MTNLKIGEECFFAKWRDINEIMFIHSLLLTRRRLRAFITSVYLSSELTGHQKGNFFLALTDIKDASCLVRSKFIIKQRIRNIMFTCDMRKSKDSHSPGP